MSIRTRLALLYSVAFVLAGTIMIVFVYLAVRAGLSGWPATSELPLLSPLPGTTQQVLPEPGGTGTNLTTHELPTVVVDIAPVRDRALARLLQVSVVALIATGLLAALGGRWLAGRALAPIATVTRTAREVAAGSMDRRIGRRGHPDEVQELADTFDAMLDRLDRAFDAQRHFVANASHELRTPVAAARTLLEVETAAPEASADLRRVGADLLALSARQEALIDALLVLARGESAVATPEAVDLPRVIEQAAADVGPEAARAGVTLNLECAPAIASGEPELLGRLVANLTLNAVRHNASGGWAHVSCRGEGGRVVIEVANSGPVVPPGSEEELFQPFRRGRERTGHGNGLGLAIVRAVAGAHGGTATARARTSEDGGGLVVTVDLPADPAEVDGATGRVGGSPVLSRSPGPTPGR